MSASFEPEVDRAFQFLAAELGLTGPSSTDPAAVSYSGPDVTYTITFDPAARSVATSVARDLDGVRLTAELPALVRGAALGGPGAVPCGARTLTEMRATIRAHAAYLHRLQPYLTTLNAMPLMRAAHARELRSA